MAKSRRLMALIAVLYLYGAAADAAGTANASHEYRRARLRQQNNHQPVDSHHRDPKRRARVHGYTDLTAADKYGRRRLQEEPPVDYDWAYGNDGGNPPVDHIMSMPPSVRSTREPTMSPSKVDVVEGKARIQTEDVSQLTHVENVHRPAIIGGVLGGTLLMLMVMAGVYYTRSERRQERRQFTSSSSVQRMYKSLTSTSEEKANRVWEKAMAKYGEQELANQFEEQYGGNNTNNSTQNRFGTIESREGAEDISTLGDPYLGEGISVHLLDPRADETIGESMMSSEHQMHVFGMSGRRSERGEGGESTTISGGLTHNVGDDSTLEDAYQTPGGNGTTSYRHKAPSASKSYRLTVVAPAGKLGIFFDDHQTGDTPIVHAIKESSVLHGRVNIGDLLISVDEMDCRGKSAAECSRLISARSHKPSRVLVLMRS